MSVNYLSLYDTLWSFHVIYLIIYSFIYSFIEVVIHLCQHALILEIKVTKKWQITIHIVYATEYQLHNAALCSTSGNSDRKACQQQLAVFRMRRNRRMGWGKKKIKQVELYNMQTYVIVTLRAEPHFVFLTGEEKRKLICLNRVTHLRSPQPKFNCALVNPVPPCNTVFVVVVVLFFFRVRASVYWSGAPNDCFL